MYDQKRHKRGPFGSRMRQVLMYMCMIKNDINGVLLAQGCVRYIDVHMYDQKRHKRGSFGSRMRQVY